MRARRDRWRRLAARWGWQSLRVRVLLALLAWVAFGIAGIWFSATRLFERHVEDQYHEELSVHVRELAGLVRIAPDGSAVLTRPLSDPRYLVPLSGFYWQVSVDGGQTLRSASLTRGSLDEGIAHSARILHVVEHGPTGPAITYGFVRALPRGGAVHYVIATDKRLLDRVIDGFTRELAVWLLALAAALLATGCSIVIFAFRPFDRLSGAIAALRTGNRAALGGKFPSEIAPLVDDLNAYIAHSSRIVNRGRVEAGNLAHFLRTPLAVIIDEAERLQQNPQTANSADVLLEQSQLMVQQIEFRMARARTAAGAGTPGAVCKVSEVLPPVVSAMRRLHPDIAFAVTDAAAGEVVLPIDPIDCAELLSNILDNAGKWARSRVEVTVAADPEPSVTIVDDGPGLSGAQIADAFGIGTRFDPAKPGSGLGLAIASDIAADYGLALNLSGNAPDAPGLTARIAAQPGGAGPAG